MEFLLRLNLLKDKTEKSFILTFLMKAKEAKMTSTRIKLSIGPLELATKIQNK